MNFWEFLVQTSAVWGTVLTVLAGGAVGVVATHLSERSKRKTDSKERNRDLAQQAAVGYLASATQAYNQSQFAVSVLRDKKASPAQIEQSTEDLRQLLKTSPVILQQHLLTLRILGYSDLAKSAGKIGPVLSDAANRTEAEAKDKWLEVSKDFADLCVATFSEKVKNDH